MHLMLLLLTVIFPSGTTIFLPPQIFSPLEYAIRGHFLAKLVLHPASDNERQLLCHPVRFELSVNCYELVTSDEQYDLRSCYKS